MESPASALLIHRGATLIEDPEGAS